MPILDKAKNAIQPGVDAEGKFIGQLSGASDGFPLEIYQMIDQSIRDLDASVGSVGQFLLRRFVAGPQIMWEQIHAKIQELGKLRSIVDCPGDLLHFLKLTLGWTADTDYLTANLDEATLRRLLLQSIALWTIRGTEDAYGVVLKTLFNASSRIWNWFDLRWILDDTEISEQHQGRDAYILSLPGPPAMDEYKSNLRVVDDGTGKMDRELAIEFVKLFRPIGERVTITWLSFLDLFNGDDRQWASSSDLLTVAAGAGSMTAASPTIAYATAGEAFATGPHLGYARLRGADYGAPGEFGSMFWVQPNGDGYRIAFNVSFNSLKLYKVVSGVSTEIGAYAFVDAGESIHYDSWYGLRWEADYIIGTSQIRIYVDGGSRLTVNDATFITGSFGFWADADTRVDCDEIEIMPLPAEMTQIGVNA